MVTGLHRRLGAAAFALFIAGLASGCAGYGNRPLYHWGDYEQLLYAMYAEPGQAPPGQQVDELTADIEQARAAGQRVPPGVHAHLGYMQYQAGKPGAAAEQFAIERRLYPESSRFMTRFLKRLQETPE